MNTRYINIIAAILLIAPFGAKAQNDDGRDTYNESVSVIGSYNPILENSFKINVAPMIVDTSSTLQHTFLYNVTPRRITSIFQPTRIKAAKITGEPTTKLYNSYFRLGMGNYWTPLFDAYYNSTRSKTLNYGARLNHLSSWGTIGDKEKPAEYFGPAHFSETEVSAFCKYLLNTNALLHTDLTYSNDYHLFYGFSDSILAQRMAGSYLNSRDTLNNHKKLYRSIYNYLCWNVGTKSINTDVNKLGYEADVAVSNLWGNFGLSELQVSTDANIHYGFPVFDGYKAIARPRFEWDGYKQVVKSDYANMPLGYLPAMPILDSLGNVVSTPDLTGLTDTSRHGRNLLRVTPGVDLLFKGFNLHAGVKVGIDGYSDDVSASVYPDVTVSKSFMKDALNITVGAVGNLDANSWNSLRLQNPFVVQGADLWATSHYDFYLLGRMLFSKKLQLDLHGSYSIYQDGLTYLPDSNYVLGNMFRTFRQDYNQIKLGGDFRFVNDELLTVGIGGNYYISTEAANGVPPLLYMPTFDAYAGLGFNIKNKVRFNAQAIMLSKMYANYDVDSVGNYYESDTIPMRIGLNAEVEYLHTRALSFFLKFDNILCQRYFYWQNYPSRRITVIGGITYTIPVKKETR